LQLQQCQRCLHIDGINAIAMRATVPAQGQATRAMMLVQQQQRRLRINNGNSTIVTRAKIAIATIAKMPAHRQIQCQHDHK
jgi:hypothetical protein